jgi:hypothetical protein
MSFPNDMFNYSNESYLRHWNTLTQLIFFNVLNMYVEIAALITYF